MAAAFRWRLGEWPGLGASLGVEEGRGGVQTGNGVVQRRRHGELELAGANGGGGGKMEGKRVRLGLGCLL